MAAASADNKTFWMQQSSLLDHSTSKAAVHKARFPALQACKVFYSTCLPNGLIAMPAHGRPVRRAAAARK
jgi:hypothetical protein